MMRLLLFLVAICLACVRSSAKSSAKARSSSSVTLHKGKASKGSKESKQAPAIGRSIFGRLFRETKMFFSSGLESLTLQLTRPIDEALPMEV
jgi:hypothetical protein